MWARTRRPHQRTRGCGRASVGRRALTAGRTTPGRALTRRARPPGAAPPDRALTNRGPAQHSSHRRQRRIGQTRRSNGRALGVSSWTRRINSSTQRNSGWTRRNSSRAPDGNPTRRSTGPTQYGNRWIQHGSHWTQCSGGWTRRSTKSPQRSKVLTAGSAAPDRTQAGPPGCRAASGCGARTTSGRPTSLTRLRSRRGHSRAACGPPCRPLLTSRSHRYSRRIPHQVRRLIRRRHAPKRLRRSSRLLARRSRNPPPGTVICRGKRVRMPHCLPGPRSRNRSRQASVPPRRRPRSSRRIRRRRLSRD